MTKKSRLQCNELKILFCNLRDFRKNHRNKHPPPNAWSISENKNCCSWCETMHMSVRGQCQRTGHFTDPLMDICLIQLLTSYYCFSSKSVLLCFYFKVVFFYIFWIITYRQFYQCFFVAWFCEIIIEFRKEIRIIIKWRYSTMHFHVLVGFYEY